MYNIRDMDKKEEYLMDWQVNLPLNDERQGRNGTNKYTFHSRAHTLQAEDPSFNQWQSPVQGI